MKKENLKVGMKVRYSFPAMPMVSAAGTSEGIITRLGNRGLEVEDAEIQEGEDMKYKHFIDYEQVKEIL